MDQFDRAQALELAERSALITAQRNKTSHITYSHCSDCGDAIPEARRQLKGVTRCVECQNAAESMQKRGLK